ncbi:MAG TPA: TonB-dependent receptor [Candidatus Krumholzibacteria bacterium]|nr:TonB-dependent receptor [Candidatus Krumholzibacteria bacterium]HRX49956.1 TonB-dependent receptor [Candidatus Krumholzibacteria bacterium]
MKTWRIPMPALLLALLLTTTAAAQSDALRGAGRAITGQGQAPAMIKGRVLDDESGEVLAYTNVYLAGTSIGTIALQAGDFYLNGLRPGTYTVMASYISYGTGAETVTVGPGETAEIEFRLRVQAILVDPIVVSGERALIEVERTGSAHHLSAKQMEAMPLDNLVQMIAQKPGVTLQDNEIHIRGGRADDTQFIIDGLSVNDPLAGGGYGYSIDPSIVNEIEVLTGGFNAEYGQAVSGVVNVSTKEGSERWDGKVSWKTDHWAGREATTREEPDWRELDRFGGSQNIDIVKGSLSGPDPFSGLLDRLGLGLPGKRYLLLSGSMDVRDGYLPIYSRTERLSSPLYTDDWTTPRQQNDWNGLAKWTWAINPRHKLNITASRQFSVSQGFELPGEGYPRSFIDNLDNFLVFTNESILSQLYYRWVVGDDDFFEFNLGRNFSRMHANLIGNDDFRTYGRIDSPTSPFGAANGTADRWHDHYAESWNMKTSYSWVPDRTNQFKIGMEMSFTEMQLVDLQSALASPPSGKLGIKEDIFKAHPIVGAAFLQDTVNYRGLVLNAGLRLDAWAPGKEVEEVMDNSDEYLFIFPGMREEFYDSTHEFALRSWKLRVSPRLGMSFPVTEKDKFFFNYGHFSQWPRFSYVYPQLQAQTATEIQLLGNPNLDPKVTVEYETGLQHEFPGLWSLGVTFFNRDIYGYAKSVGLGAVDIGADETPDPDDTGTVTISPVRYFNGDSARSLGVELSVIKRTTRWLSGSASLELSRSTGTNSSADEAYLQAVYDEAYTPTASAGGLRRTPLLWDKPWKLSVNLDFSVFEKQRPELLGWRMPSNWSVNVLYRAEAGRRYTPQAYADPENPTPGDYLPPDYNSAVGPYTSTLNLRFNKFWKVGRKQRVTFFLEGRNIFNHINYRRVNAWTGDGYQVGDYNPSWTEQYGDWYDDPTRAGPVPLTTDSEEYAKGVVDPSYVEDPRTIMMGVSYSW